MQPEWTIYYESGVRVDGASAREWLDAPATGVQAIVEWRIPNRDKREVRWAGVSDRVLWTGTNVYDPFGYGLKFGTLVSDEEYWGIWEQAAYGDR